MGNYGTLNSFGATENFNIVVQIIMVTPEFHESPVNPFFLAPR